MKRRTRRELTAVPRRRFVGTLCVLSAGTVAGCLGGSGTELVHDVVVENPTDETYGVTVIVTRDGDLQFHEHGEVEPDGTRVAGSLTEPGTYEVVVEGTEDTWNDDVILPLDDAERSHTLVTIGEDGSLDGGSEPGEFDTAA